ncbi:hypothetical protein LSUB1_G007431 [Lachnellula subtilissima]|uniref:BTB domain-containing protein n=1 Tax=Lachnellula subtilissima TaxID=602034 RepID=A0A8H8U849_9HELO|nr:hypothetical protein LSUB1_G007431 [Lachnellula subtilissima]
MAPSIKGSLPLLKNASLSSANKKAPSFHGPTQVVTFKIGPNLTEFVVHKEFACYYSPVLKAAFESEFIEGRTQTYTLDDTTEDAFRLLVQWLYSQRLTSELRDESSGKPYDGIDKQTQRKTIEAETKILVSLWVLVEKLLLPSLQNDAMGAIIWFAEQLDLLDFHVNTAVYAQTAPGSQLRRVFVDLCAYRLGTESIVQFQVNFSKEMLLDILVAKDEKPPLPMVASNYYVPVPL